MFVYLLSVLGSVRNVLSPLLQLLLVYKKLTLDGFLYTGHCFKSFICINSFNHHKEPTKQVVQYYYSHFTEEEAESQRG